MYSGASAFAPGDEGACASALERRRRLRPGGDGLADQGEELLLACGRAHAQQPRRRGPCVGERVRGVGRHVDGLAGAGDERLAAKGHLDLAVKDGEHLLEVVPVRRRPAARGHVHVDERVLTGGVLAGDEDRVGVADEPDVRQALVAVRPCDGELTGQIVGRDGRGLAGISCCALVPLVKYPEDFVRYEHSCPAPSWSRRRLQ